MINDLYNEYDPIYQNVVVSNKDLSYRSLKYWSQIYKINSYTKKHPKNLKYFKGYSQSSFGRVKQIKNSKGKFLSNKNSKYHKYPKMYLAIFRRERKNKMLKLFSHIENTEQIQTKEIN